MSFVRYAVVAAAVVGLAAVGCSSSSGSKEEESVDSAQNELKLYGTRYLGKIYSGESRTGTYDNPPRYRSYGFDAKGGDEITIDVKSVYGDAVTFLSNSTYNVLTQNDDANANTLDSHIFYKLAAGKPLASYRIVFRDYDLLDATFTVKLSIKSAPATCFYNNKTYQEGATFPSADGCNTCNCGPAGVGCTKKACVCDPANEPNNNYVGTPTQCATLLYNCQSGWVPFQNACGCGCTKL